MSYPLQIRNLIEAFQRLPGVGEKTAARLTFYLLHVPEIEIKKFGDAVLNLKSGIFLCQICKNISDKEVCDICSDSSRNQKIICVVEQPLDVFSFESTGQYNGLYHVLHGVINPLHGVGPEELYIDDLLKRLTENREQLTEVILALNPTMEGEATSMYLAKQLRATSYELRLTRLGMGMPTGGDIQYADATTLTRAMEGRREY
jgi:recombination protein RecR